MDSPTCMKALRSGRGTAGLLVCVLLLGCGKNPNEPQDGDLLIGALLPFTGALAPSGHDIERSLLWATEQINSEGGVAGRRVRLVSGDTHSEVARGLSEADRLMNLGILGLVGPEDGELTTALYPVIDERKVVLTVGGVTAPIAASGDTAGFDFHVVPSPVNLATVLARRISSDGPRRLAVFYVDDEYGRSFTNLLKDQLGVQKSEAKVVSMVAHPRGEASFRDSVVTLQASQVDAVVLITYPSEAAGIINETPSSKDYRWYFGPSLRTPEFIQNTASGGLIGLGVSFALSDDAKLFTTSFEKRWPGYPPSKEAFFYYDSLVLLALSIEGAAARNDGATPSGDLIRAQVRENASNGQPATWYDLKGAFRLVREKADIDYRGVTGSIELTERREVGTGLVELWRIDGLKIETDSTRFP
jgi:ABC-type branched-subunit amino acid transport system substrate-binding protein